MMRAIIMFGLVIGSVTVAEPIDRSTMLTDAEVDAKARKWGEEVVQEDGARAQHESLAKLRQSIWNSDQLPVSARIEYLSMALSKISRFSMYQVAERIEIYEVAQEKMGSIPSHTNYFTDKIEKSWKTNAERVRKWESLPEWQAAMNKIPPNGEGSMSRFNLLNSMWEDYDEVCSENLGMLGHIPSKESVLALGRYLQKRDEPGIIQHSRETAFVAAKSLTELISDGPIQTWQADGEDIPKWQQWFDEVKAGKRIFRFVGSDVDYTLDGPADARTLERIRNKNSSNSSRPHPSGRREHAIASEKEVGLNKMGPVLRGGLIAAILLCSAALAFFLKCRNVA